MPLSGEADRQTPSGRQPACPQCGAPEGEQSCRSAFDELLAFEFVTPAAFGGAHHLTVASYSLQHSRGYVDDARAMWRELLDDALLHDLGARPALDRARIRFEGSARILEPGAMPPGWWPTRWSCTACDALPKGDEPFTAAGHVERVRAWATAVRNDLLHVEQISAEPLRDR
jgi:hypothetical protein